MKMRSVDDKVWGAVLGGEFGRGICDSDQGAVFPAPEVHLGWLDNVFCEMLRYAPSFQEFS